MNEEYIDAVNNAIELDNREQQEIEHDLYDRYALPGDE